MSDEPAQSDETHTTGPSTPTGGEPALHVDNRADFSVKPHDIAATPRDLAHEALAAARRSSNGVRRDSGRTRRRRPGPGESAGRRTWSGPGADAERDPQRLGSIARSVFADRGWKQPLTEARIFTDWPNLVGADIASHCTPTTLRDGELRLAAASTAWATQIRLMGPALLARLATELGANVVKRLTVSGPSGPSWKHGYRSVPGARGPRDTYG